MGKQKLVIIGAGGMVGAAAAYACAVRSVVEEIVLIDRDADLAWGQAADINDAMGIDRDVEVRPGTYRDIATNDIVVITAGAPQQPGQTRLELVETNAAIMRQIIRQVMQYHAQPYLVIVSNPVDVMTYVALRASGLPKQRVLGTGTMLDTARLKSHIADQLQVCSRDIDAYILGEHGDSSFSTIETAQIGDIPLTKYPGFQPAMTADIEQLIRQRAYRVIETKHATYFAIGFVVSKLVSALLRSAKAVYPVCSLVEGEYGLHDVVVSLPSTVSRDGVHILTGYPLTTRQQAALQRSAQVISQAIYSLDQS